MIQHAKMQHYFILYRWDTIFDSSMLSQERLLHTHTLPPQKMQQTFVLHTQEKHVICTAYSKKNVICTAYSKKHVICTAYSKKVICTAHSKKHSNRLLYCILKKARHLYCGLKKALKKQAKKGGKKMAKKVTKRQQKSWQKSTLPPTQHTC